MWLMLLTVTDAQSVRSCSRAARGARTSTSVRKIRRCVTTAHVATWTMTVMSVSVTPATLGRHVVSAVVLCQSSSAPWHNLPLPSVLSSSLVSHECRTSSITYFLCDIVIL